MSEFLTFFGMGALYFAALYLAVAVPFFFVILWVMSDGYYERIIRKTRRERWRAFFRELKLRKEQERADATWWPPDYMDYMLNTQYAQDYEAHMAEKRNRKAKKHE